MPAPAGGSDGLRRRARVHRLLVAAGQPPGRRHAVGLRRRRVGRPARARRLDGSLDGGRRRGARRGRRRAVRPLARPSRRRDHRVLDGRLGGAASGCARLRTAAPGRGGGGELGGLLVLPRHHRRCAGSTARCTRAPAARCCEAGSARGSRRSRGPSRIRCHRRRRPACWRRPRSSSCTAAGTRTSPRTTRRRSWTAARSAAARRGVDDATTYWLEPEFAHAESAATPALLSRIGAWAVASQRRAPTLTTESGERR